MSFHTGGRERRRCLDLLGLTDSASEGDIRSAYKAAALKYHPDKNPSPDAKKQFQEINTAYSYLTEGDTFLDNALDDEDDVHMIIILHHLFPWLFEDSTPRGHRRKRQDTYSHFGGWNPFSGSFFTRPTSRSSSNGFHSSHRFYYDSDSSDEEKSSPDRSQAAGGAGATLHGQYFHEQAEKRGAKKRNRHAKRAQKQMADEANKEQTCGKSWSKQEPAKTVPQSQKPEMKSDVNGDKSSRPHSNMKDAKPEEQVQKKSKKQILAEQKQREKEAAQVRADLERMEREKKEKLEKKKALEEEKEKKEKERREAEEQRCYEEEVRKEEERKRKEEERKKKQEDEEKLKRLIAEFDQSDFMDASGDFKSKAPDLVNVIRRDDLNSLTNHREDKKIVSSVNGFDPADLIKLQKMNEKNQQTEKEVRDTSSEKVDNSSNSKARTNYVDNSIKENVPQKETIHEPQQRHSHSDRPQSDRPQSDRPHSDRPQSDKRSKGPRIFYNQQMRIPEPHFNNQCRPPRPLLNSFPRAPIIPPFRNQNARPPPGFASHYNHMPVHNNPHPSFGQRFPPSYYPPSRFDSRRPHLQEAGQWY